MNQSSVDKLITKAIAIEETEAMEAGAIGYMARILVQATIPHSDPKVNTFERTNGNASLAIMGHPKIGLPYGVYPRLILAWISTEAVRTKSSELLLGNNLSRFMSDLGLTPSWGVKGTTSLLRNQMMRLFSSSISCVYLDQNISAGVGFNIARDYQLWWDPKKPDQDNLWESTVTLGSDFFNEIIDRPVPIDMRAIEALKMSSMALDLYNWLTYRLSYLKRETDIPWPLLQRQFGSNYADTRQGRYKFKQKLILQLKKVMAVYSEAKVSESENGLLLRPSKPHITKRKK